jgi:hypothetical protein
MKNKMMMFVMTALTLTGSLNLAHAEGGSESEFKGDSQVKLAYVGADGAQVAICAAGGFLDQWLSDGSECDVQTTKYSGSSVGSDVIVKTWGEGKVLVIYSTDSSHGCAGIRKTYVGYETAYETYNLYELSASQTDVDPTTSRPNANFTITKGSANLGFMTPLMATSTQSSGYTCEWSIGVDTALKFDLVNN